MRVYDADSNTWFRGIDLLSARAAPCALAIQDDGVVVVTGGGAKSTDSFLIDLAKKFLPYVPFVAIHCDFNY